MTAYQDAWYQQNKERISLQRKEHYATEGKRKYERRRRFFDTLKLTSGCVDCGFDKHPSALDFDHISEKNFNVASAWNRTLAKLIQEIMLCEIRCANCHRIKHSGD